MTRIVSSVSIHSHRQWMGVWTRRAYWVWPETRQLCGRDDPRVRRVKWDNRCASQLSPHLVYGQLGQIMWSKQWRDSANVANCTTASVQIKKLIDLCVVFSKCDINGARVINDYKSRHNDPIEPVLCPPSQWGRKIWFISAPGHTLRHSGTLMNSLSQLSRSSAQVIPQAKSQSE